MTPKASKDGRATGKSFKGVFLYLMHDKRLEGEAVRDTSERLDFVEMRNLMTDDPNMAYRIMAATAAQQDNIKRDAGSSIAGNKSDQVVFHYSLGWHPDEKDNLSKSEMLRAADESIRALGAQGHQAAIIAHNDTKHPHVHVVINRVNPEHGKMLNLWNYQKNLSKWALSYEQGRGQIYCEQRQENWKRRDLGQTFSAEKSSAYHRHDQAKTLGHVNDNDRKKVMAEEKAKDSALAQAGEDMHTRHTKEWKFLSAWYAEGKAKISGLVRPDKISPFKQAAKDVREQFKPLRSQLGKQQWQETKDFERSEKSIRGKLENALTAVKVAKELGGVQASLFNHITSSAARKATMEKLHRAQWRNLNSGQKAEIGLALAKVKKDQDAAFKAHRATFATTRQSLKTSQAEEKQELKRNWQNRNAERTRAFKITREADTLKREEKASPERSKGELRGEFKKAKREGRKRKGRVRKRDP